MSASPLPKGNNAAEMIRRLRAIDAEIFGTLYANAGIIGGDVEIQGDLSANDIYSENWVGGGGTVPLALPDSGASVGYALDSSLGIGQFQNIYAEGGEIGSLDIVTTIQMLDGAYIETVDYFDNFDSTTQLRLTGQGLDVRTTHNEFIGDTERMHFHGGSYYDSGSGGSPAAGGTFLGFSIQHEDSPIQSWSHNMEDPTLSDLGTAFTFISGGNHGGGLSDGWWLTGAALYTRQIFAGLTVQVGDDNGAPYLYHYGEDTANPAYTFQNDWDTGMGLAGTNILGFSTAGSLAAQLDQSFWYKAGLLGAPAMAMGGVTAAAPGWTFASDTNTGMYRAGTDRIGFSTGGSERLEIGDLGIKVISQSDLNSKGNQNGRIHYGPSMSTGDASIVGTIAIKMPLVSFMGSVRVTVYNYASTNSGATFIISGYTYRPAGQNSWLNYQASVLGGNTGLAGGDRYKSVRLVATTGGVHYILIGDSGTAWQYPQVNVEILGGFNQGGSAEIGFYEAGVNNEPSWGSSKLVSTNAHMYISKLYHDDGQLTSLAIKYQKDQDTGWYRSGSGIQVCVGNGSALLTISPSTGLTTPGTYNLTTGAAANVNVKSGGQLTRFTSARKYKTKIDYEMDYLADIMLRPAKFYREDDKRWYLGLIADDAYEAEPLLGMLDDKGEIENYDIPGVIAVLIAKVNRLEAQVKELS